MSSQLKVFSASAGSGKTFRLVVEYISKLMSNPKAYRNILAVTFTNKATAEMKNRIMSVLYSLSEGENGVKAYVEKLKEKNTSLEDDDIRLKAKKALQYILHDYSNFWIETLDSFFQKVLRNLAKEIGVGSSFNLLLDDSQYVEEAIKRLKTEAESNATLQNYLNTLVADTTAKGEAWNYERSMMRFAGVLNKRSIAEKIKAMDTDLDELNKEVDRIKKGIKSFEGKINELINGIISKCKEYNLNGEDFKGKKHSLISKLERINGHYTTDNPLNIDEKYLDSSEWLKKDEKNPIVDNILIPLYKELFEYYNENHKKKRSELIIVNSVYKLYLLKFVSDIYTDLLKEDDMFVLKQTAPLLSEMVGEDDASFVYEKIGNRIDNIMIDEFQDTSELSWKNLKFLIKESLSKGEECALFGDIKQSIYRWNDGDWRMLADLSSGKSEFNDVAVESLKDNYRTAKNIVEFNNGFFSCQYKQLASEGANQDKKEELSLIADSVVQNAKMSSEKTEGEVRFIMPDEYINTMCIEGKIDPIIFLTLNEIEYYTKEKGYALNDIVLLFRNNDKLSKTAFALKENGYNTVSDDAFTFEKSLFINTLIRLMYYMDDNKDTLSKQWLMNQGIKHERLENISRFSDLKDSLLELVLAFVKEFDISYDDVFLFAFFDELLAYGQSYKQSLKDFLKYWEDTLSQKKVASQEIRDAIRLSTIHKSKGLEYPVVIVPFCDWKLVDNGDTLWVDNEDSSSNIKVFPSTLNQLEQTGYEKEVKQERYMQRIDNMNMLYVAFTRPKYCLSAISRANKKNSVGSILQEYISHYDKTRLPEDDSLFYTIGNDSLNAREEHLEQKERNSNPFEQTGKNTVLRFESATGIVPYALSGKAKEYLETDKIPEENEKIKRGIMLHAILSKIKRHSDLDFALSLSECEHTAGQKEEMKSILEEMLALAEPYHWFDGTYEVMNEQPLFFKDDNGECKQKRPDRIMMNEKECIVVDYKFSENRNSFRIYAEQLREYGRLLSEITERKTRLYLWFTDLSSEDLKSYIEEVK